MRYEWGYKYGTGICPVCKQQEPLDSKGKLAKHKRQILQSDKTVTLLYCDGKGKIPVQVFDRR